MLDRNYIQIIHFHHSNKSCAIHSIAVFLFFAEAHLRYLCPGVIPASAPPLLHPYMTMRKKMQYLSSDARDCCPMPFEGFSMVMHHSSIPQALPLPAPVSYFATLRQA